MRLRIKFRKYGPVRYIGHLDLMRFFQKAIRRAQIDVAYSGGFSPHQIMAFAAPLGVGLASNGEYMDIEVNSMGCSANSMGCITNPMECITNSMGCITNPMGCINSFIECNSEPACSGKSTYSLTCQDIMERLNRASVSGIEITSVKILPDTAGNAMASVTAAAYTVSFREGREPKTNIGAILPDFLAQEQILITKETKKGVREIDLKQGIYQLYLKEDGCIYMLVDASSGGNIKPIQVMEALLAFQGRSAFQEELLQENALLITREDVYTNIGSAEEPAFVSLDEVGMEEAAAAQN